MFSFSLCKQSFHFALCCSVLSCCMLGYPFYQGNIRPSSQCCRKSHRRQASPFLLERLRRYQTDSCSLTSALTVIRGQWRPGSRCSRSVSNGPSHLNVVFMSSFIPPDPFPCCALTSCNITKLSSEHKHMNRHAG